MKVIGVEFRLGMESYVEREVFVHPVNITFPLAFMYPYGQRCSVTVHTSRGDVGTNLSLSQNLPMPPLTQKFSKEEVDAAYDSLTKQIERIQEGAK